MIWVWPVAAGLLGAGVYVLPHAERLVGERRLRRRCAAGRTLVLTYDDGPGAKLTPRLLELLQTYEARATFFVVGFRADANPGLVDRIVGAGHEVGCHGYGHRNAWRSWPWSVFRDITRGYESLKRWVPSGALFRPPYGKLSLASWLALRLGGTGSAWWTVDCHDTLPTRLAPQAVVDAVARDGGGAVLMHDFDGTAERAEYVLEVTELLLRYAAREGLRVCRFGDLSE